MDFASRDEAIRYCEEHEISIGRLSPQEVAALTPDALAARSAAIRAWSADELTPAQADWVENSIDREERVRRAMRSA